MIIREIKTAFSSEVPILDLEISNDITTPSGKWEYDKGDVVSCAIFYGNAITCILREKSDDITIFKDKLKSIIDTLPIFYAFNYLFEKECLKGFLGKSYFVEEIKPFRAKNGSKQSFLLVLINDKKIDPKDIPQDNLKNDSGKVLDKYAENDFESIITHNVADVIKQYFIWKNRNYLLKKYSTKIKDGWYQGVFNG